MLTKLMRLKENIDNPRFVRVDALELETEIMSSVMKVIKAGSVRGAVNAGYSHANPREAKKKYYHHGKAGVHVKVAADANKRIFTRHMQVAVRRALHDAVVNEPALKIETDEAFLRIANVVLRTLPDARLRASEATIEKMVEALIETQDPMAPVSAEIDADNAKARFRFMQTFSCLSAEQVTTQAGSNARNRSQTASRWKNDGKIFAVSFQSAERFPAFQFKDGRPIPAIAQILKQLPPEMSPWETAFWFVSTNGWLDGASPLESLGNAEQVIEAARREGEAAIG
jgi:hypothetical protein